MVGRGREAFTTHANIDISVVITRLIWLATGVSCHVIGYTTPINILRQTLLVVINTVIGRSWHDNGEMNVTLSLLAWRHWRFTSFTCRSIIVVITSYTEMRREIEECQQCWYWHRIVARAHTLHYYNRSLAYYHHQALLLRVALRSSTMRQQANSDDIAREHACY